MCRNFPDSYKIYWLLGSPQRHFPMQKVFGPNLYSNWPHKYKYARKVSSKNNSFYGTIIIAPYAWVHPCSKNTEYWFQSYWVLSWKFNFGISKGSLESKADFLIGCQEKSNWQLKTPKRHFEINWPLITNRYIFFNFSICINFCQGKKRALCSQCLLQKSSFTCSTLHFCCSFVFH